MNPALLAAAATVLASHRLSCRFEPAEDDELTDDELTIVDSSGADTQVHIQISNNGSRDRYFIVGECDGESFRHHPPTTDLGAALIVAITRIEARKQCR